MNNSSESTSLFKKPAAWIPMLMSLAALVMIVGYVSIFGIVQHQDEGTPAHIFQLIMAAQLPIAAFFAFKWLPKHPRKGLVVLVLQAVAWIIPIIAVVWFEGL
jgi:hypothetical protein